MSLPMLTEPRVAEPIQMLTTDECWRLLHRAGVGRLGIGGAGRVEIFPIHYLVYDKSILLRSAPGTTLVELTKQPEVAFEIDGEDSRWHWSVIIHGRAVRLDDERDIIRSGVRDLASWSPTAKFNYVRILPDDVIGRRIDRHLFRRSSMLD